VNIEFPGAEVVSLVVHRDALTAMTILVEETDDLRNHFGVGSPVHILDGRLRTPGTTILIRRDPFPVPSAGRAGSPADARTCANRVAKLVDLSLSDGAEDSLLSGIAAISGGARIPGCRNPFARTAYPLLKSLARALVSGDNECLSNTARSLVGLGPGLTPSGDDLIGGLMLMQAYGTQVPAGPRPVPAMKEAVIEAARTRTHILSRIMLERAACGITTVGLDRLLRSLVESEPPSTIEMAARTILELGATSGEDFLAGIVLAWSPVT
jgi:hypothetical protein